MIIKNKRYIYVSISKVALLLSLLIFSYCQSVNEENAINKSLALAGENRHELEKVLKHFEKDSLKLEAAKYLIRNMPYHNYYDYDLINTYYSDLYALASANDMDILSAMDSLNDKYRIIVTQNLVVENDVKKIHSQYLIDNIEHAFKTWENAPWKNDIDFSMFCREILPYRVEHEPFENWREVYYNKFKPVLDSLSVKDVVTAVQFLYDSVVKEKWIFAGDTHLPHRSPLFLLDKRMGSCAEYSIFMSCVMRSLAIPGGRDMIVQNPDQSYKAHYWNYVTDKLGNTIDFALYEKRPTPDEVEPLKRLVGKVYRKNFEPQTNSLRFLYPDKETPNSLSNFFLSDVSSEYIDGVDLVFETGNEIKNSEIAYISVFNNRDWIPIDWTRVKKRKVVFKNLEPGIVYALTTYEDNTNKRIDFPVLITKDGKVRTLIPKTDILQTVSLFRKYPYKLAWYSNRMAGGEFQGANNIHFDQAVTFYTIPKGDTYPIKTIKTNNNTSFKYFRYLSAPFSNNNMAEITIRDENNQKITGNIIGTDGSYKNNKHRTKYAVFDNDPLTFYDAENWNDGWVGLELDSPRIIHEIDFVFRNDDNFIRPGDKYELFYFTENETKSLGIKIGTDERILKYQNVPINSLLLLKNWTRGNEERIFTYENDTQIWW